MECDGYMGRKKKPADQPDNLRIEIQASPSWLATVDKYAATMDLSRSAFIRLACNEYMASREIAHERVSAENKA
jgi:hypothetical protein